MTTTWNIIDTMPELALVARLAAAFLIMGALCAVMLAIRWVEGKVTAARKRRASWKQGTSLAEWLGKGR